MQSRRFRPMGIDQLEDRMVMSVFSVPFTLDTTTKPLLNEKFLTLTKHTQTEIAYATTASFSRFKTSFTKGLEAYETATAKANPDTTTIVDKFEAKVSTALARLNSDLLAVSRKLPYGAVNLDPVLVDRVTGTAPITDTTTGATTFSLETEFEDAFAAGAVDDAYKSLTATLTAVRSDINDYTNLGVTNGYFKLGRGAILPQIS